MRALALWPPRWDGRWRWAPEDGLHVEVSRDDEGRVVGVYINGGARAGRARRGGRGR